LTVGAAYYLAQRSEAPPPTAAQKAAPQAAPKPTALAAAPAQKPRPAGGVVTLSAVNGGHFVSPVEVNGRRVTMLVDTGASLVALSHEDARTLGVYPLPSQTIKMSTANGVIEAGRASLSEVRLDTIVVRDVAAVIMPPGAMRGSLLGMSFLSRLRSFQSRDNELILTP
jgi:aspartyl protease family protein